MLAKLNFTPNNQSFISKKPTTLDRADSKSASDIANNKSVSDLVKSFMRPTPIISPQKTMVDKEF